MTTETQPDEMTDQQALELLYKEIQEETERLDAGEGVTEADDMALNRYVRIRQRTSVELDRVKDQMKAMVRDLERRLDAIDYVYKAQAEQITARKLQCQKTKSVKLPWGTVGFRTSQANVEVEDEEALQAAALANEAMADVVKMEWRVSKSGLNAYVKATGDVPAGCKFWPASEKFFVR